MLLDSVFPFGQSLLRSHLPSSRHGYTSLTRTFLRSLAPDADYADITETAIDAYLKGMETRGRRPATRNGHLYALRAYCAWLVTTGKLPDNPALKIKPASPDDPIRAVPSDDQVRRLLAACELIANPHRKAVARAVLTILCYSGVRRNELLHLDLPDINLKGMSLKVRHGKGDKPRTVKVGSDVVAAITAYLPLRPICRDKAGNPVKCKRCEGEQRLILLRCHVHLADGGLRTLLRDLQAMSGQPGCEALLPHGFRHHFASRLDAEGATIKQIKEVLGHKEIATTERYIHVSDARFAELAELVQLRPDPNPTPQPPPATGSPDPVQQPLLRLVRYDEKMPPGA